MLAFRKRLTSVLTFAVALSTIAIVGAAPALADPVPYSSTPKASWGVNGKIWAVEIVGNTVFVGGEFTQATNGASTQPRQNLAAFDLATGNVTSFKADVTGANASVRSLESNGTDLWVGGWFTQVAGQSRANLAEVKVATGAVDAQFTPDPNEKVNALLVNGTDLYAGGLFTTIGDAPGNNRQQVAKITTTTGDVFGAFRANADPPGDRGNVWDIELNGNTLYVGGSFTEFQNVASGPVTNRKFVAALNKDTGAVTGPSFGDIKAEDVDTIEFANGILYAGTRGQMALADDNKLIAFNPSTGARLWENSMDGDIQGVEVVGGTILYGSHDGKETNNDKLLSADAETGKLEVWRPEVLPTASDVDGVKAIRASANYLVVAGDFDVVGGVALNSLAIFNAVNGSDTTPPSVPGNLRTTNVAATSVALAWNASTDNVAVSSYEIYRNGARVGTTSAGTTSFTDNGLTAGTAYVYTVRAVDTSSNQSAPATLNVTTSTGGGGGQGRFIDDDDSVFEADIEWLAAEGVTKGCNPPTNDRFCPDDNVTRGQMAAFLVRFLGLSGGGNNTFVDDNESIFEADITKLAAAGITKGCNPPANDRFCPDSAVSRGQMAAFLHRADSFR